MKEYPPLVYYKGIDEYRNHYIEKYCRKKIHTFRGMRVFFPRSSFEHLFYESSRKRWAHKDIFSRKRAERIDWIAAALSDRNAQVYEGWDTRNKRVDPDRLVFVTQGNYVVIIRKLSKEEASIVTAFPATRSAIRKIKLSKRIPFE